MRNKISIIILVLCCWIKGVAQSKEVIISGRLINYNNRIVLRDLSQMGKFLPTSQNITITPDSAGNFSTHFRLDKPKYFLLGYNQIYLSPGDKIIIYNDVKKDISATTFKGKGADANVYLTGNQYSNMGAYIYGGSNLKSTPNETYDYIMQRAGARKRQLEQLKNVTKNFKRLEEARIKADVVISLQTAPVYIKVSKTISDKGTYLTTFNSLAQEIKKRYLVELSEADFLEVPTVRDILPSIIESAQANSNVIALKNFQQASNLSRKMLVTHDKTVLQLLQKNIDSLTNIEYRNALSENLAELLRFGAGDEAIDFKAIDISGNAVKLSDLRGKVIYIDLWATWCGPCLREMPALEALKAKYRNDNRIVFLSLSIDGPAAIEQWKKNVGSRNADGYQWRADNNDMVAYSIVSIPRILLIDDRFKMVDMDAPLPSHVNVVEEIDKLLK